MIEVEQIFKYVDKLPSRIVKRKEETEKELEKRKEETETKGSYWRANWNQETYFKYIDRDNQPLISRILAILARIKRYGFENYDQTTHFFSRNEAAAKRLKPYSLDRITKVCEYLNETADYKWTLETVEKFALEDIDSLKGDDPIIILTNGEKIYDTDKLRQLESQGRIKWQGNKWLEL